MKIFSSKIEEKSSFPRPDLKPPREPEASGPVLSLRGMDLGLITCPEGSFRVPEGRNSLSPGRSKNLEPKFENFE